MISRVFILIFGFSCLFISLPSAASETGRSLGEKADQSFGESVAVGLIGDSLLQFNPVGGQPLRSVLMNG